jgi:hypothetical protein
VDVHRGERAVRDLRQVVEQVDVDVVALERVGFEVVEPDAVAVERSEEELVGARLEAGRLAGLVLVLAVLVVVLACEVRGRLLVREEAGLAELGDLGPELAPAGRLVEYVFRIGDRLGVGPRDRRLGGGGRRGRGDAVLCALVASPRCRRTRRRTPPRK